MIKKLIITLNIFKYWFPQATITNPKIECIWGLTFTWCGQEYEEKLKIDNI